MKLKLSLFLLAFTTFITYSQKQWTLKECVDEALKKNISIQQNRLTLELAKKDVDFAKGNFLPNLGFNNSHRGSFGLSSGISGVNTTEDRYSTSFSLNAGGTIFNGFRNTNTYKQAQLGVESSLLDLQKIENDVSLRIVDGYLNILFAKENLEVAKVQYQISNKQIEAAKARFESGVIPKGDLLNVESTAASNLQGVITQENNLDLALLNLAQLLQVSINGFDIVSIDVGTPSASLFYKNSDFVYEKSLETMPEISRAKLAIDNANYNIDIAKGAYMPSLTYSAGSNTSYFTVIGEPDQRLKRDENGNPIIDNNNNLVYEPFGFSKQLEDQLSYSVGFNLNIPIFNRFQTKNRVVQQEINKLISETRLESEKLILKQTIEQAFLDVKTALKAYEAAKISLEAQDEAFKNAQESYNFGTTTQFDFDQVRTRLVNAQATLIRSKYDYVFKTKILQFYSGELVFE